MAYTPETGEFIPPPEAPGMHRDFESSLVSIDRSFQQLVESHRVLCSAYRRLYQSHARLLAAAKVVLSAVHAQTIGHPHDLDSAIDQLETAVIAAEESAP